MRSDMPGWVVGVCEVCNRRFKSELRDLMEAGWDVKVQFVAHTGKRRTAAGPLLPTSSTRHPTKSERHAVIAGRQQEREPLASKIQ